MDLVTLYIIICILIYIHAGSKGLYASPLLPADICTDLICPSSVIGRFSCGLDFGTSSDPDIRYSHPFLQNMDTTLTTSE